MNKKIFAVLTVLFMASVAFGLGTVSAAKVVDHGTRYVDSAHHIKLDYTTYQYNNNFLKMYTTAYYQNPYTKKYELNYNSVITFNKVSKTTLKFEETRKQFLNPFDLHYAKTKLTAAQYYWRVFKMYW